MRRFILYLSIVASLLIYVTSYADETSQSFFSEAFFTKPQSPDAWGYNTAPTAANSNEVDYLTKIRNCLISS